MHPARGERLERLLVEPQVLLFFPLGLNTGNDFLCLLEMRRVLGTFIRTSAQFAGIPMANIIGEGVDLYKNRHEFIPGPLFLHRIQQPIPPFAFAHPYVSHPQVLADLETAVEDKDAGVFVFFMPPASGKSSYLTELALKLQAKRQNVVLVEPSRNLPAWDWFHYFLDLGNFKGFFDTFLPPPQDQKKLVIIIDHFERSFLGSTPDQVQEFVTQLASRSTQTKKFVTIVAVADAHFASKILGWNNNQKIRLIGHNPLNHRWKQPQVAQWVKDFKCSPADKDKLITAGVKAGSIGFLLPFDPNFSEINAPHVLDLAETYNQKWVSSVEWLRANTKPGTIRDAK
jgi:hypothetical protein